MAGHDAQHPEHADIAHGAAVGLKVHPLLHRGRQRRLADAIAQVDAVAPASSRTGPAASVRVTA